MIYGINELNERGQRMSVQWKKARDYFNSLTLEYFAIKADVESGKYGSEHTNMRAFMIKHIGVNEPQFIKMMNLFDQWLVSSDREILAETEKKVRLQKLEEEEESRRQRDEEKAKKLVEKEAAEREKAEQKAKADAEKAEQKAKADAEKAEQKAKVEREKAEKEAEKKTKVEESKRETANKKRREQSAKKSAALSNAIKNGDTDAVPESNLTPVLATLLAECKEIEKTSRIELGKRYAMMREEITMHRAGRDPAGKWWTWTKWVGTFLERTLRDAQRCIDEYYKTVSEKTTSCRLPPETSVEQQASTVH